ncbi:M48 family metallopeptidase [Sulfurovum sp. XGS-02]|nr:M48 family metallopeptidase [Sulfurovum sp. XGS-02]
MKAADSVSVKEINKLVKHKSAWIVKKLESIGKSVDFGEIVTGSRLFYLGKSYYVNLIKEEREDIEVEFIHSKFKIKAPTKYSQESLQEAIDQFYQFKAQEKITKLVRKWSNVMQLFPEHIAFRKSKTKWGSCSPRNRLSFNPELMKLSSSLIEYVVVHELAHIVYKNHSKEFWALIKKFIRNYSQKEEELKVFERKL